MKQFLQCDEKSSAMVVALNDRAFCRSSLLSSEVNTGDSIWIELVVAPKSVADATDVDESIKDATITTNTNENNKDENDENDNDNNNDENDNNNNNNKNEGTGTVNVYEVQSVAIISSNERYWCAVARHDKSLCLYCINKNHTLDKNDETITISDTATTNSVQYRKVSPIRVYHTNKRAGSLSFAIVPYNQQKSLSAIDDVPTGKLVIIAGDLAGDVVAFAVPDKTNDSTTPLQDNTIPNTDSSSNEHTMASKYQRRLLGHTASMLTSVHVVPVTNTSENNSISTQQQRIITSDRDEKIRVSYFPESFRIDRYLLGHTNFISDCCVVAASNNRHYCASISGDGTLRLWDYSSCTQVAIAYYDDDRNDVDMYVNSNCTDNNENDTDNNQSTMNQQEDENEVDDDTNQDEERDDTHKLTPSRLTMNQGGDWIASIYEDCNRVDLWKIVERPVNDNTASSPQIELLRSLSYETKSQPLAISFLKTGDLIVLSQDPTFQQILTLNSVHNDPTEVVTDITSQHSACHALRIIAQEGNIQMPQTLLERDARTQKIKLQKLSESRGGARVQPWNNSARLDIAKERIRRVRKRRRTK